MPPRRAVGLLATALLAALPTVAHADPVALRAPGERVLLVATGPALSVAGWLHYPTPVVEGFDVGFALEGDLRGGPVGASLGARRTLVRSPTGFGLDVTVAGSLLVPVASPALAIGATPSAFVGWRGDRLEGGLGLVAPLVGRVAPDPSVRASVLVEPWVAAHVGLVSVGAGAAVGPVFTAGELWAVDLRWMLTVGVDPAAWQP